MTLDIPYDYRHVALAAAIAHMEGFFSTKSAAYRNNNPGNLREVGAVTGFAHYPHVADGWEALIDDIDANAGKTLTDFVYKYAPPAENDSANYLQIVTALSGIQPSEVL